LCVSTGTKTKATEIGTHPIIPHCPKEKNILAFDLWQALSAVSCRCSLLNYALKLQPKKKKEKEKEKEMKR
jgi:hypothetical protein